MVKVRTQITSHVDELGRNYQALRGVMELPEDALAILLRIDPTAVVIYEGEEVKPVIAPVDIAVEAPVTEAPVEVAVEPTVEVAVESPTDVAEAPAEEVVTEEAPKKAKSKKTAE